MEDLIDRPNLKDPIRYLSSVHRRMGEEIGKLAYYVRWKNGAQLTEVEEIDVRTTLDYLDKMIPLHARDEEGSLVPHILGTGKSDARIVLPLLVGLEEEQAVVVEVYAKVQRLFRQWVLSGSMTFTDVWALGDLLNELRRAHRHHVLVQERQVFPLAEKLLCGTCRTGMVREMLERRGLEEPMRL